MRTAKWVKGPSFSSRNSYIVFAVIADRILVPFSGHGAGAGELSWGQQTIWRTMRESRSSIIQGLASPVPPGFTIEDMADEVRFIMNRYPAMRTRLRFDADGTTRQVVDADGEIAIEVVDVDAGEDPAEVAGAIRERYTRTIFDYANEWPIRIALVRRDGALSHAVRAFCHLASDGMGFARMAAEVFDPDRAALPAPATMEALDQARWQQTTAGQQQSEKALRYWEGLLRSVPTRRFPDPVEDGSARGPWVIEFASPAMRLAMRAVAARVRARTSAVLLAAFALGMSRVTGADPVVTRVLVSNRFRTSLSASVSPIAQPGLLVVGVDGASSFDEAVARTQRAAMGTYKHAYYDPERLRELVARMGRERGAQIDLACLFNDRRLETREAPGPAPTEAEISAVLPETSLRWAFPTPGLNEKLLIIVHDAPGAVAISAMVDTAHLAPERAEALLRAMEEAVVGAVVGPEGLTPRPQMI